MDIYKRKIMDVSTFLNYRHAWLRHCKVVFTNGCFDLLHAGHVDYLQKSKNLGNVLVVGLNSDISVRRLKGAGRPVNNQEDRALVLAGLASVDYVLIFEEDTPYKLIKGLEPDILVKGGDWSVERIIGRDVVWDRGGQVQSIPLLKGYSSTAIIERIRAQS